MELLWVLGIFAGALAAKKSRESGGSAAVDRQIAVVRNYTAAYLANPSAHGAARLRMVLKDTQSYASLFTAVDQARAAEAINSGYVALDRNEKPTVKYRK